jgi:hypothetical protein
MHEHTLDQPFVAEGQFWLPETPEQRIAGTLNYSPGSITVGVHGCPRGDARHETLLACEPSHGGERVVVRNERQYTAADRDGHRWTFSRSLADVDRAEWGGVLYTRQ